MKAILVDDSPQARRLLQLMLEEHADKITVVGEAENALKGMQLVQERRPDVVFLDIEMPGKSGIQMAEQLLKEAPGTFVVFTTAYNEYALKAFRLSAVDYLLKPLDETQLAEAVEKLTRLKPTEEAPKLQSMLAQMEHGKPSTVTVPTSNGYQFVPASEILYIEADGSYVNIYLTENRTMLVSRNLKYFEQALQSLPNFFRAHRAFLINMHHMRQFDRQNRGEIVMADGKLVDLARNRRQAFMVILDSL